MATSKSAWKQRERDAAAIFGCKRQPLSGSAGRDDATQSDSTHPKLFIETKLREKSFVKSLHDEVKGKAKKEGKIPVLCLAQKGCKGMMICVHSDDINEFIKAYQATGQP